MNSQRSFVILLISTFAVFTLAAGPDLAIELFRHGARGPLNDTFGEHKWGSELGQLTAGGLRMHYLLGVAMRKSYDKLITKYDPATTYFRSTDVNRTIMSAQAHVLGLYEGQGPAIDSKLKPTEIIPPFDSPIIQETIEKLDNSYALPNNLQAVPIHVVSGHEDHLLRPWDACPISSKWLKQDGTDKLSKEVFENDLKDLVTYLREQKLEIKSITDLYTAGDNTITDYFQGLALPGKVDPKSDHFKSLLFASEWWAVRLFAGDEDQKALFSYNILNYIVETFEGVNNKTSELKYVALSAHDTTLLTILHAFNIVNPSCLLENYRKEIKGEKAPFPNCRFPEYASDLVFEFTKGEEPTLVLKYNNVLIPACGTDTNACKLKDFKTYVANVTHNLTWNDYKSQCGLSDAASSSSSGIWVVILLVVCIILAVALASTYQQLQKKTEELITSSKGGEYYANP